MNWPHLHILVTRPQERAQHLVKTLVEKNVSVLLFPTLTIHPIEHPHQLEQQLVDIAQYDYLFFISPNAVDHAMPSLLHHHTLTDLNCQWACVGAGTYDALKHYGVHGAIYPEDEVGAQALLNLMKQSDLNDKKCAVFTGNSGNDLLEQGLRALGAQVKTIICYQRLRTQDDPQPLAHAISQDDIDLIVITSGEALNALRALLPPNIEALLLNLPLVVISPRIEKIAQSLGFHRILLAEDASDEKIVMCIDNWLKTRSDND